MSSSKKDAQAATRSKMNRLLTSKLIAKYGVQEGGSGVGMQVHPANKFIQAEVDLFMHSHSNVQDGDLAKLEQKIRHGINSANTCQGYDSKRFAHEGGAIRPGTGLKSCGVSTPNRTAVCRAGTPASGRSSRNVQASRSLAGLKETHESRPRPRTAGCATFNSRVQGHAGAQMQSAAGRQSSGPDNRITVHPSIKNEWLILETYHQLMSEDKHAEEQHKMQKAMRHHIQGLEEQMRQNLAKAEREKRELDLEREENRRLFTEHEAQQRLFRDALKRGIMKEKRDRAYQIMENERRREKERLEKQADDEEIISECKKKLREEQEAQLKKRKDMADSLAALQRENIIKRAERERQKVLAAEEEKRLMQAYKEKLDREEAQRAAELRQRMERYEMIGKQWAEDGAGKKQREIELAEERRILTEARRKEMADEERERRDKQALRQNRADCIRDNKLLTKERLAREKVEDEEEAKYARQFRSEGEKHVAEESSRKREMLLRHKAYARELMDQMKQDKERKTTVVMSDRERLLNRSTLRLLQEDKNLQARICRRILQYNPASKSAPTHHGTSNG